MQTVKNLYNFLINMKTFKEKLYLISELLKYNFASCKNFRYFSELNPIRDNILVEIGITGDTPIYDTYSLKPPKKVLELFNQYFKKFCEIYNEDKDSYIRSYYNMWADIDTEQILNLIGKYDNTRKI